MSHGRINEDCRLVTVVGTEETRILHSSKGHRSPPGGVVFPFGCIVVRMPVAF